MISSFPGFCAILSILTISLLPSFTNAVMADDEVYLASFNQSFYLKNETYRFQLVPAFNVPLQVLRHTIYTASTATVITIGKRVIMEYQQDLDEVSPEDYDHLNRLLGGDVPDVVRINGKKRSLPPLQGEGTRIIRLSPKIIFFHSGSSSSPPTTRKRGLSQVEVGTVFCLNIPFFTTCDNSPDLTAVKGALQDAVDEIHAEIDSYTKTNDARMNALTNALNAQRSIVDDLLSQTQHLLYVVGSVSRSVQLNAAQIADGDYQIHSQINYLKRVTTALLKYSNALASTDPRAVVAQPSLSKLFAGFIDTIATLNSSNFIPILDSRVFTWQETILPAQSVNNITTNNCTGCTQPQSPSGQLYITSHPGAPVAVFTAIISIQCTATPGNYPEMPSCVSPAVPVPNTANWIYGPFHKDHYGIYPVSVPMNDAGNTTQSYVMQPVISSGGNTTIAIAIPQKTTVYCVQFLGYTMLASFATTVDLYGNDMMINGVNVGAAEPSDCDDYRLIEGNPKLSTSLYSLYAESEGVVIPFYSNCDVYPLVNDLLTMLGSSIPDTVPTINYVCSNAWSSGIAQNCGTGKAPYLISGVDVYERHWVTPNCYINIEPSWLELDYYVNPTLVTINNIPRGYTLNQFTINPEGELASSLEFVYTNMWVNTYTIRRISQNYLVTDEASMLDGSPVLFYMDPVKVIDVSDAFYGERNNGRDCIRQQETYDYDLLGCFYQNDNSVCPTNQYRAGLIPTTGIARYIDKYDFGLDVESGIIYFTLVPQEDVDFVFSIEFDGNLCPQLNDLQSFTSGCAVSLFYLGNYPVTLVGSNSKSSIPVTFINKTGNININFDTWTVQSLGRNCFLMDCHYTTEFSVVRLVTPDYTLISQSDQALESEVAFSVDNTITGIMSTMNDVMVAVNAATENITSLRDRLALLDFNVTALFPYEDVATMREQAQALINKLNTNSPPPPGNTCEGFWGAPECWPLSFIATVIGIGIVVGVVVIGYVVCIRMGLAKKILGKKEEKREVTLIVYNAD